MRILVVEDHPTVSAFIVKGLREELYAVDLAEDGKEGLYLAQMESYDLIIQDIMLPKVNGLKAIKTLRASGIKVPIIALTARSSLEDRIDGLDAGADDYLCKPFAFAELLARIRAILRRDSSSVESILRFQDLEMNPLSHEVHRASQLITLTAKEYSLLEYFLRNIGRVLSRTLIMEHVWDMNFDTETNVVDVYIRMLRKKIDLDFDTQLIHTVRGVGYVMGEK